MKTVNISNEVYKPRWSTTEMPRSSQIAVASYASAYRECLWAGHKKKGYGNIQRLGALTWAQSGQSLDGRIDGNQAKMLLGPKETRLQ